MTNQATIYIDDGSENNEIILLKPLRILKGKRAVFEARWKGETVLVKLFTKERYWQREQKGVGLLSRFRLPSPGCLNSGLVANSTNLHQFGMNAEQKIYFLILVFYKNAQDFRSHWRSENLSSSQRIELFSKLMVLLAQHHQAGIIQKDLHLGNFLIVNNELVTIDGDAIEHNASLSIKECYRQLGILLAQSFPKYDAMLEALLPRYFDERKLEFNARVIKQILKSRATARKIAKNNWVNKAYRESTQFKVTQTINSQICIVRAFVCDALENKIFALIDATENNIEWVDENYQYKATRYTKKSNSERRFLAENEASIRWLSSQLKLFFGEDTVMPVALVLKKIGPFHTSGFFVQAQAI